MKTRGIALMLVCVLALSIFSASAFALYDGVKTFDFTHEEFIERLDSAAKGVSEEIGIKIKPWTEEDDNRTEYMLEKNVRVRIVHNEDGGIIRVAFLYDTYSDGVTVQSDEALYKFLLYGPVLIMALENSTDTKICGDIFQSLIGKEKSYTGENYTIFLDTSDLAIRFIGEPQ